MMPISDADVVEVAFGPHIADWWLVWLTAVSILASTAVAWAALWNGRRANQIARDSADRDQAHRDREEKRHSEEERSGVALAMLRALVAIETVVSPPPGTHWADSVIELEKQMLELRREAFAQIDLYTLSTNDWTLSTWFSSMLYGIDIKRGMAESVQKTIAADAHSIREAISEWRLGRISADELLDRDFLSEP